MNHSIRQPKPRAGRTATSCSSWLIPERRWRIIIGIVHYCYIVILHQPIRSLQASSGWYVMNLCEWNSEKNFVLSRKDIKIVDEQSEVSNQAKPKKMTFERVEQFFHPIWTNNTCRVKVSLAKVGTSKEFLSLFF